jgi:hypothetical protein
MNASVIVLILALVMVIYFYPMLKKSLINMKSQGLTETIKDNYLFIITLIGVVAISSHSGMTFNENKQLYNEVVRLERILELREVEFVRSKFSEVAYVKASFVKASIDVKGKPSFDESIRNKNKVRALKVEAGYLETLAKYNQMEMTLENSIDMLNKPSD